MIGWGRMFLFVFFLVLLCFYISWKSDKFGNTVNTEYLNRIPSPESGIPDWSECTGYSHKDFKFLQKKKNVVRFDLLG